MQKNEIQYQMDRLRTLLDAVDPANPVSMMKALNATYDALAATLDVLTAFATAPMMSLADVKKLAEKVDEGQKPQQQQPVVQTGKAPSVEKLLAGQGGHYL